MPRQNATLVRVYVLPEIEPTDVAVRVRRSPVLLLVRVEMISRRSAAVGIVSELAVGFVMRAVLRRKPSAVEHMTSNPLHVKSMLSRLQPLHLVLDPNLRAFLVKKHGSGYTRVAFEDADGLRELLLGTESGRGESDGGVRGEFLGRRARQRGFDL